jgi:hypothetical protein
MRSSRVRRSAGIGLLLAAALGGATVPAAADDASRALVTDEPPFLPGTQAWVAPRSAPPRKARRGGRPYHPAPGIVVDVVDDSGAVIQGMQRTARNLGYWPFRRCYEEGLRRNQALTGTVSMAIVVTPQESDRRTEVVSSSVKDDVVTACVAREAHHITLDPVQAPVTARIRVLLALGDEPVPGPVTAPGGGDLRAVLRMSWPEALGCFEAALARRPDAGGRMELRFDVDADGTIARVAEAAPRFPDAEATDCVVDVFTRAALVGLSPALRGKAFVYPMHFESRSGAIPPRPEGRSESGNASDEP